MLKNCVLLTLAVVLALGLILASTVAVSVAQSTPEYFLKTMRKFY